MVYKMNKKLYIILLALPVIMLLGLTIFPITSYFFGKDIKLNAKAYSSGYNSYSGGISLNYDIARVNKDKLSKDIIIQQEKSKGKSFDAYAILAKKEDVYEVSQVELKKPKNGFYLKCSFYLSFEKDEKNVQEEVVYLNLPIDQYYTYNKNKLNMDLKDETQVIATIRIYKGNAVLKDVVKK